MLKLYLADLVYDTVKTNYVVPLNIAYIAAYVMELYGDNIEVKLFKYPHELEHSLNNTPPDILGLSNYSWNERLNQVFVKLSKRVNPNVITVMGGPNIRTDHDGIESYLKANEMLDYYVLFEGEEPFCNLVGKILSGGDLSKPPIGCAGLVDGILHFEPMGINSKSGQITFPSPYLTGLLDDFITDPNMIPLFETNRGCPFGCTYCTWGIAALSKIRTRSLDVIIDELNYVAQKSAKQVTWIFCDANFGILKRDIEIAQQIRRIMDYYGYPISVTLWHSKNTGERNIEIAKTIKDSEGYIAIQSADPEVLKSCGRGNIKLEHIMEQIDFYKNNGLQVMTDILIGLPNETAESHLKTLAAAFDLGFGIVSPMNIRMLPGSQYESKEDREKYGIKTKFRPIFGAYGVYDGQNVFEIEESVRATKDMTESELESFKIMHWLIHFCWNIGFCKPILRFAQEQGVNPALVLHKICSCEHPLLANAFAHMEKQSLAEWFETKEEAIAYYEKNENFNGLVHSFVKLNQLWIAVMFQDAEVVSALISELTRLIKMELDDESAQGVLDSITDMAKKMMCVDLLQKEFCEKSVIEGKTLSYVLNDPGIAARGPVEVEIYRDREDVDFCHYNLNPGGEKDYSIQNLTRFFEMGGGKMLNNRIRVIT